MKVAFSKTLFFFILTSTVNAFAGLTAYSGIAGEKLFLQNDSTPGSKAYFVKLEGAQSKWSGKVIKTMQRNAPRGDRFFFDYQEELITGKKQRTYEMIVENGTELNKGSRVKKIEVWYPEVGQKALIMHYDEDLTKKSEKIDLQAEHKKNNYQPEMD